MSRHFHFGRFAVLLAAGLAALYVFVLAELYFNQAGHVYHPDKEWILTPKSLGLSFEDLTLTTSDGVRLSAWFVPVPDAKGTVIVFHGNAGNMSSDMDVIEMFHALQYNTLIFDYRGFGKSEGKPDEQGTYRDAQAAWDWLVNVKNEAPARIALCGRSLGAAIAAELATRNEPRGLMLEAAFTSLPEIGQEKYPLFPVKLVSHYSYDTRAYLKRVRCPVLLIHSRDDEIVPFHHAERLADAVDGAMSFVEIGGLHRGGFEPTRDKYFRGVEAFLR